MTVPIWNTGVAESVNTDNVESLCYEVHGEESAYFNLISDECTSVNGYYERAVPDLNLNVISQIVVRARGTNTCWNIQVDLYTCWAAVDRAPPPSGGSFDGITVRSYPTSSRVRISVPNCADSMLVMWVFCRDGQVEDPITMEFIHIRFIRLMVRRGLNLNEQSHGLIGTKLRFNYFFPYLLSPFSSLSLPFLPCYSYPSLTHFCDSHSFPTFCCMYCTGKHEMLTPHSLLLQYNHHVRFAEEISPKF